MKNCIVILSYNHPELTAKCVKSALSFSLPIILVHNGSLKKNIDRLQNEFDQIDHFIIEKNAGWTNGVNQGLSYAYKNFKWVFLLTNDTELLTCGEFPHTPGFIAPLIYFRKLSRVDSMGGVFIPHLGKLRHIKNEEDHPKEKAHFFYVPGTAFLLHQDVFNRVGKFDERLHTYWEDVDFSMRAHRQREKIGFNANFSLLHKVGKTCHDNPFYTTYLFKKNRKIVSLRFASKVGKIIFTTLLVKEFIQVTTKYLRNKDFARLRLFVRAMLHT